MTLLLPVLAALAAQLPAAAEDAFAFRRAQPAAFATELTRLRTAWREARGEFDGSERLAHLLAARDASSAADYRRRLAAMRAFRARIRADVADALAGRTRTEWLNGRWLNNAARSRDADVQTLFRRVFADQYQLQQEAPEEIVEAAAALGYADVRSLARNNAQWLKSVLARIGWFDISRYGAEASQAAWLIVQHADHDPAWQQQVLEILRPRVARGDMQGNYFAYLVDRVAVNAGRPQTYGTQGLCMGPDDWRPRPLADPDEVDRLRAEVGLEPIAAYRARFACRTPR
ncbi:MAG TPA: DUF6624 domain-containing protein [Allosphingosinicella sp.]